MFFMAAGGSLLKREAGHHDAEVNSFFAGFPKKRKYVYGSKEELDIPISSVDTLTNTACPDFPPTNLVDGAGTHLINGKSVDLYCCAPPQFAPNAVV